MRRQGKNRYSGSGLSLYFEIETPGSDFYFQTFLSDCCRVSVSGITIFTIVGLQPRVGPVYVRVLSEFFP
jgi:hypothetical protein